MQLREYLRTLRRRWRIVTAILLLAVVAASVSVWQSTPQYRSTTTLFVSTGNDNAALAYQGTLYSAQRVKSYAALATGRELAGEVVKDLGLDESPAQLASRITAQIVPDTVLLRLAASSSDPQAARRIVSKLADLLVARVKELETPQGATQPIVSASVIEPADIPSQPFAPEVSLRLALAVILGLALGVVVAFVRELLDNTVSGAEDVAKITDVPVIGQVPYDGSTSAEPTLGSASSAARGEAFRILRTSLQFIDVDRRRKVVLVTSSVPEEGKTTVAVNLAEAVSKAGSSVLLIDADLRQPAIGDRLKLESAVGLTTAVIATQPLADFVQQVPDLGIDVLTSGPLPPNPSELLQAAAMRDLLEEARASYDMVVIDGAPLLPVADSSILAAMVDGSLVVARHGRTTTAMLSSALHRLRSVDARVFGVVLNRVRGSSSDGYGYGYYGYGNTPGPEAVPAESAARSS